MNRARTYQFLTILWACFSVSFAWANETPSETTKAYSLGEVVVSAPAPGAETITTLEITDVDIENRNAKTLDKALELLPGIDVSNGAQGTPRVNIRGFRSRHTILLLNGIPINSTYDGQFDPHLIATENISKIKVSYGNHSVLYGQGGLAGVINIITKQGTKGLHGDASGEIDERGNHYSKASISGGDEKTDFFISLSNKDSDGFLLSDDFNTTAFEDGGIRDNSDDQRFSLFGNLSFKLREDLEIGLTIEKSSGEFGTPPVTFYDKKIRFLNKNLKYDRIENFDTFSSQLSMSYDPKGIFGFRAWGFTNNYEEDIARYDDDTYTGITKKNNYTGTNETSIQGLTLQTSLDFNTSGKAVFSFSSEKDDYTSDMLTIPKDNKPAVLSHESYDLNIYSTALEYQLQLLSKLDVVMGYSHHWQTKDMGKDEDEGSYMIGTSLKISDDTTLRASYARKIRFASIKQLYDPTSGSSSLKPEQSTNYEAGITQKLFWDMDFDLTFFQNDVEDYIEKNDTTDLYENNEEYQFKGFEIGLARKILKNGSIGFGYSYLKTEDKSTGTKKDELQYRPKHKFTIDANYTWDMGLTAHADFMHVAKQYYYSDTFQKGELDNYSIINLKLEQTLYKTNLSIYLGLDNLLDEDYEESNGYPQAGRTAYAGLRIKF